MILKIERDWLLRKAALEANGIISVGGLATDADKASKENTSSRRGSVADAFGATAVLRTGDDIMAQVRAESDEWGDR